MGIIKHYPDGTVRYESVCPLCRNPSAVDGIPEDAFEEWFHGGRLIQEALPMLSVDDREILISGTHGKCWDETFPELERE